MQDNHTGNAGGEGKIVNLVTTKSDAEIAADIKARIIEAAAPLCAIFDEAAAQGLGVQWDSILPAAPYFKHAINGLKIVRHY